MLKRMILMLVILAVVLGGIFGFLAFKAKMIGKVMASFANQPQTVSTIVAAPEEWQSELQAAGSLLAVNGANISGEVAGIVGAIHFESGDTVKEGAPLLNLDADDDIAHLNALKASAALAKITYDRDKKLGDSGTVSKQVVDTDLGNLQNAQGLADQQQALVNYKSIQAPFTGRLGIRLVNLGQYLPAGTPIVTLQQLDPIFVDFYLPQQELAQVKVGQAITAKIDAFPDKTFDGKITAIDATVDTATRNVHVRASMPNADYSLLPGMYTTVHVAVREPQQFVTLPQTAIAYNSYGDIVFLIDDKGKDANGQPQLSARQVFVTTGATRGDQVAITSGVKPGDTVVTAGQLKLRNDTPVKINNSVQPSNDANPVPVDQ